MKIYAPLAAAILSLVSAQSLACSCSTVVIDKSPDEEKQDWLTEMATGSDIVVLARITSVAPREGSEGDAGQYGVLEIREIFKGKPPHTITVTTGMCANFVLKAKEERVFFVGAKGRVRGCSEYRHAMKDEEVAMRLRRWRRGSAT